VASIPWKVDMKPLASCVLAAVLLAGCAYPVGPGAARAAPGDADFALMQFGMSQDDALRLLGKPNDTMKFPLSGTEAWTYRYFDTWGYLVDYSLTFAADGTLIGKLPVRLNDGGNHGG
jgi:hypothetical protein